MDRRDNRREALDRRQQAISELKRRGLWGYVEPVLTMGSAIFAEPVSGMVGLAALPYGADAATNAINRTQQAMTYQPRTEEGQGAMQAVGEFMQPVGDAFIGASEYLGDAAYDATGSPALGAAAYSVPTMALEALGLKGAKHATRGHRAFEVGDIGKQGSQFGGKQRGIFAGVKAKGADLDQMKAAQELQKRGLSRDEIWQKTGWFEDVDGNWKWEINDALDFDTELGSDIQPRALQMMRDYGGTPQGDLLYHPEMYDNYPSLRHARVITEEGSGGTYRPKTDTISVGEKLTNPNSATDLTAVHSLNLHELQHAIQEREGFAKGGAPSDFSFQASTNAAKEGTRIYDLVRGDFAQKLKAATDSKDFKALIKLKAADAESYNALSDIFRRFDTKDLDEIASKALNLDKGLSPRDQYLRLAGEAEARNVQTRMNMTPEERAATPPWSTLDVPEGELIVNKKGGGVAMSVDKPVFYHGTYRDFDEFDPFAKGDFSSPDTEGVITLTPYKEFAERYAKGDATKIGDEYQILSYDDEIGRNVSEKVNPRVIAASVDGKIKEIDSSGKSHDAKWMIEQQKIAKEEGYDAIQFIGMMDDTFYNPMDGSPDTLQVLNPKALKIIK